MNLLVKHYDNGGEMKGAAMIMRVSNKVAIIYGIKGGERSLLEFDIARKAFFLGVMVQLGNNCIW